MLAYKRLPYELVNHQLGLPQLRVLRLSGQRKVPVIEHDGRVVSDSTDIALYIEEAFPEERRLLPDNEAARRDVLALEDRIDRVFGLATPVVWLDTIARDRETMEKVLEVDVHGLGPPGGRWAALGLRKLSEAPPVRRMVAKADAAVRRLLEELCDRLAVTPFLVGKEPSLADVAAAGLPLYLKFPHTRDLGLPELAGSGLSAYVDDARLARFFDWRDELYASYLG